MSTKTLCNSINRFKSFQCVVRFSDYFDKEVLNLTSDTAPYKQFDVSVTHESDNGSLLVKIVTLGVSYKVSKLTALSGYHHLIKELEKY